MTVSIYEPLSQCESSAYDSMWLKMLAATGTDESRSASLVSPQDITTFLRACGLNDDFFLSGIHELDKLHRDTKPLSTTHGCKYFSKLDFFTLVRWLSIKQRSNLQPISVFDLQQTCFADVPLFNCDSMLYRPSSACERSAYESIWRHVNTSNINMIEGAKVVKFALKSGLSKETLSRCWGVSLNESGSRTIEKDEFFVFLRCISFAQTTGIYGVSAEHITSTANRDLPLPDFEQDEYSPKARHAIFPAAFYFPQTKFETRAYDDIWLKAVVTCRSKSADAADENSDRDMSNPQKCSDEDEKEKEKQRESIGAVGAVTFLVTCRLHRSILKGLWAICSPLAGPVSGTRLSREQFNTLLRGISLAQQFPTQLVEAASITNSALMDLRLPRFDFHDADDCDDKHFIAHTHIEERLLPSPSSSVHREIHFQANKLSPREGHHIGKSDSEDYGDIMNSEDPFVPIQVEQRTFARSSSAIDNMAPQGSLTAKTSFRETTSASASAVPPRAGSISLLPESATRAGSIGFTPLSVDTFPLLNTNETEETLKRVEEHMSAKLSKENSTATHPTGRAKSPLDIETENSLCRQCVCGDTVERFKQDCVRLRCKCMIHTWCLASYIKSQLDDSSMISAEGIRCSYWHTCRSYITMDDVDKFSSFVSKASSQPSSSGASPPLGMPASNGAEADSLKNFGTDEVDKFTRFSIAASFNDTDLAYCPSCSTPFWVDEKLRVQRVVCLNPKCGVHFCRFCQVPWHTGMDCSAYQTSVATGDKLSHRYVAATSKRCPSCNVPFTHYHGHSCHHISPVGSKGGGCPSCHVHFCYACLSTAEENVALRGDRRSCRCPKGKWGTFCESTKIQSFLIQDPYPHDSRCGCPICPDCRYQKPCGGLGYSGSSCDGTCVVCTGLVDPGPLELRPKALK